MRRCNICLVSKAISHKFYGYLQLLSVLIYCGKNFLIGFMIGLPLSANWKSNNYNSILIIIDHLIKIMHFKPVKVTINTPRLVEVIINMVVQQLSLPDSIISICIEIFMSKFWFLLYYFLGIKRQLFTAFHLQTNRQTE